MIHAVIATRLCLRFTIESFLFISGGKVMLINAANFPVGFGAAPRKPAYRAAMRGVSGGGGSSARMIGAG